MEDDVAAITGGRKAVKKRWLSEPGRPIIALGRRVTRC
jgi:hypothetical protein